MSIIPHDGSEVVEGVVVEEIALYSPPAGQAAPGEWDHYDPTHLSQPASFNGVGKGAHTQSSNAGLIEFIFGFVKLFGVVFVISIIIVILGVLGGAW